MRAGFRPPASVGGGVFAIRYAAARPAVTTSAEIGGERIPPPGSG